MNTFSNWKSRGITPLAHVMAWYGDGNPQSRDVGYVSSDQRTISKQADLLEACGFRGAILTWQGTKKTLCHQAVMGWCYEMAARGMQFMLLLDPNICINDADKTASVIAQLNDPSVKAMLNSPAYVAEHYVLDFNTGIDRAKVGAATGTTVLQHGVEFAWLEIGDSIGILSTQNNLPTMKVHAVFGEFFDGGLLNGNTRDYNSSCWKQNGKAVPTRIVEECGGDTFWRAVGTVPTTAKYVGYVAWNDYYEHRNPLEASASTLFGDSSLSDV
jgi:hypothetical protein